MDRFDRQRRLFGDVGQERLRTATVGIVGAGGLGSFMVLELAYLGVGKILIVDEDCLDDECSNRNRLVGAWASHQPGTPKVQILRDLALQIDPKIEITVVKAPLENDEAKAALAGVDLVAGCVDHDGPRFALNEILLHTRSSIDRHRKRYEARGRRGSLWWPDLPWRRVRLAASCVSECWTRRNCKTTWSRRANVPTETRSTVSITTS